LPHQLDERIARDVEVGFGNFDDLDERVVVEMILRHQNDVGVLEDLFGLLVFLRMQGAEQEQEQRQADRQAFRDGVTGCWTAL